MTKLGEYINSEIIEISRNLPKGACILDLGCGAGGNSLFLAEKGLDVTCVDRFSSFISEIKEKNKNVKAINQDIMDFDFSKNKYSLVLAINILQFFDLGEMKIIVEKILNSLKEDGILYLEIFSTKDSLYEESFKNRTFLEDDNQIIFSQKINSKIRFFKKEELFDIFSSCEILNFKEVELQEEHEPFGKHKHGSFVMVIRKNNNLII
jgi:SAM-dependent methyltransferase